MSITYGFFIYLNHLNHCSFCWASLVFAQTVLQTEKEMEIINDIFRVFTMFQFKVESLSNFKLSSFMKWIVVRQEDGSQLPSGHPPDGEACLLRDNYMSKSSCKPTFQEQISLFNGMALFSISTAT